MLQNARVAQLVERDLAKVEAAGSSPVSRSFYSPKIVSVYAAFGDFSFPVNLSPLESVKILQTVSA